MTEYRIRESGDIKSQGEIRAMHKNTSFPKVWGENVHEAIGIDPVLLTPKPAAAAYAYKRVVRNGVEQDANGNWVQAWVEQDMFVTDDSGTKAEQEAEYQAKLDVATSASVRNVRNERLAKTDWLALSDTAMSAAWATYRQALRDVTAQEGFPNSITWPDEPS